MDAQSSWGLGRATRKSRLGPTNQRPVPSEQSQATSSHGPGKFVNGDAEGASCILGKAVVLYYI